MTETTRVPMTLRDHFFEDPFFSSNRNEMETFRNQFFKESSNMSKRFEENLRSSDGNMKETEASALAPFSDSIFSRNWLAPPRWMLPKAFDEHFKYDFGNNDSNLISHVDEEGKMEISLNTAGYKPEELKVQVADGAVKIEGKHEEKSQEGNVMVSRQFSKTYSLPQGAKKEEIVSNLSQDGVMVITVPKEKKIQEITGDQNIAVEHKKSFDNTRTKKDSAARKLSDTITRQEDFKRTEDLVPFTMRDSFFSDPFFQSTRGDIISSRNDFFKTARENFEKSLSEMESDMTSFFNNDRQGSLCLTDTTLLKVKDKEDSLEISLDTTGYKPDELKVTVGQGMVSIEGKHEEKSEAGKVMVARQFSKSYGLPEGSKPEEVVSNLSKDGVLLINVPKAKAAIKQERKSVPIAVQ